MADKLKSVGVYRILYAQPAPETGERVAVAVLVQEPHSTALYYDRKFPRLKTFFGDLELEALEYYLDDLKRALLHAAEPDNVLNTYAPQIVPSDSRKVALPLDENAARALMQKLLELPSRLTSAKLEEATADPVAKAIEAYMKIRVGVTGDVRVDVPPEAVFGKRVPGLHPIALGVRKADTWVLVDGVDLNEETPKAAIKRADVVARNFWQFNREAARSRRVEIKRIGLVLNGTSHLRPALLDAHDYSLHRLEADADRTFDGSSPGTPELIRRVL